MHQHERVNVKLYQVLTAVVDGFKEFGFSGRDVSRLAFKLWTECADERDARRQGVAAEDDADDDSCEGQDVTHCMQTRGRARLEALQEEMAAMEDADEQEECDEEDGDEGSEGASQDQAAHTLEEDSGDAVIGSEAAVAASVGGEGESGAGEAPADDQTQPAPSTAERNAVPAGAAAVETPECAGGLTRPAPHDSHGEEEVVEVVLDSGEVSRMQRVDQQAQKPDVPKPGASKPKVPEPEPEEGPPRGGWSDNDKHLLIKRRDELPSQMWLNQHLHHSNCTTWTRRTTTTLNRVLTLLRGELAQLWGAAEEVLLLILLSAARNTFMCTFLYYRLTTQSGPVRTRRRRPWKKSRRRAAR
jgi:hypothetical protein